MNKCKLCNKNNADKKGSHIVPHFLLKRIENIENKTGRDYELGFTIERLNSSSHFGRSVQPEKLEETYGELTDEDIEKNNHPLIVDNFFCSECEERFANIESLYSQTINIVDKNDYTSGINTSIGILFWSSILWRMSINGKSGVKLNSKNNELIRNILDSFLSKNIDQELMGKSDLIKSISYKLIRFNDCKKEDPKWLLFHPEFENPLCLLIDEFILLFSLNGDFVDIDNTDCFSINKEIINAPINKIGSIENISSLDNLTYKRLSLNLTEKMKNIYLDGLDDFLDEIHRKSKNYGLTMPKEIKQKILNEITSDEKKLGRKYNQEEILLSAFKILKDI